MIFGYARVSTAKQEDGNSIEGQEAALRAAGATEVFVDVYTGTKASRPQLDALIKQIDTGDTLMVTKLDRIARSVIDGASLISSLLDRGIAVNVLNIGLMDSTPTGKLLRNVLFAFAEFERDMIVQRTQEGKAIAKTKAGYKDGRPNKYTPIQLDYAMDLLNGHSYAQVEKVTGMSISTLTREHRRREGR